MKIEMKNIILFVFALTLCIPLHSQTAILDSLNKGYKVVAYDIQPGWKMNGSVSTVDGETLSKSFTTNIANTLNGRLPGLVVMPGSGEAGSDSPTLRGRGLATFGSGQDMFVIIDGFPSSLVFFEGLSSSEIKDISFLKDAAATAMYGGRAANGVLVVTTKRGEIAPLKINFDVQYGLQDATRLPQFLDAANYATLYNEALVNDFGAGSEKYSADDINAYRTGSDPYRHPNVNWYNQTLRDNAPLAKYNFSAKGGSSTVRYFVLLNLLNNQGLYKRTEDISNNTENQSYNRVNFRTNVDVILSKNLSAMVTLGGSVTDKTTPGVNETTNDVFNLMGSIPSNAFSIRTSSNQYGGTSSFRNPLAEIAERGFVSYNGRTAQASAKLIGDLSMITPGLSIAGAVSFHTYFKSYSKKTRDYSRYSANQDGTYSQFGESTSLEGSESSSYQWRNTVFQGFLNYERQFEKHDVNALLVANYDEYTESDSYGNLGSVAVLPYKNAGFSGRVGYAYDKRYIADFSFGYTGNDAFKASKRYGFFPAGSLGWVVSNEGFLKNSPIVNYLKLRGSYGLTGNVDIGTRFLYNQFYTSSSYPLGNDNGSKSALLQATLANPNATWEKDTKLNIGFDATLFENIAIGFDYFKQNRSDILTKPYNIIPDFSGFSLPSMNVGEVENKGFELTIGYNKKDEKLSYYAEYSASFARNEIINSAEAPQLYSYLYKNGQRINQPFVLEATGLFSDHNEINSLPTQTFATVQPGDIKYRNQNPEDDNIIDVNDYVPLGYTSMPELTMGLNLGAEYKGFDISMFFQAAMNRTVYWSGYYFEAFQNYGGVSAVALDRWTEATKSSASYPRLSSSDNLNNYKQSSFWQKNGNFLKLRTLELGYTLPKSLTKRIGIEKTRFFLNGTNLFSIDHMEGLMDPESSSNGIGYPVLRTISLGLAVQL